MEARETLRCEAKRLRLTARQCDQPARYELQEAARRLYVAAGFPETETTEGEEADDA